MRSKSITLCFFNLKTNINKYITISSSVLKVSSVNEARSVLSSWPLSGDWFIARGGFVPISNMLKVVGGRWVDCFVVMINVVINVVAICNYYCTQPSYSLRATISLSLYHYYSLHHANNDCYY